MKVLFLAGACPHPPDSGGTVRTYNLLKRVCERHEITLIAPSSTGTDLQSAFGGRLSGVVTVRPPRRTLSGTLCAMVSRLPYIVRAHENPEMNAAVLRALETTGFDLIHCDSISAVQAVPQDVILPKVFNAHNVEAAIWERYLREERRPWMTPVLASQLEKVRAYESHLPCIFSSCVVVCEHDEARMHDYGFKQTSVVRNGVDLEYYQPLPDPSTPHLLFVGSLDWRPNQDALRWFLESIWPLIRANGQGVRMTVVGRRPPRWIRPFCSRHGARLSADAPDVRPHLAEASVVVVPIRIGGGSRLKILEAMAAGRPVVSTTIGAEGLGLVHNENILIADRPPDFAQTAVDLLADHDGRKALASAGRRVVEDQYGWDAISTELEKAWAAAVASGFGRSHVRLVPTEDSI